MFFILMAILGEIGFMTLAVLGKRLRNRGVVTRSILGAYGLLSPVWAALALYFIIQGDATFTPIYCGLVAVWIGICYILNSGTLFISKFQSLSEGVGYRFSLTALCAFVVDSVFFNTTFNPQSLISMGLLFLGGTALSFSRQKQVESNLKIPVFQRLGIILFLAVVEVATYSLFKMGAQMQESYLFHNVLSQALLFPVFFLIGRTYLISDIKTGIFPTFYIWAMMGLMLAAAIAEGFAIAGLPVSLIIMFSLIRVVVYALHDIKTRELPLTPLNGLSIAMIAAGLVYTVVLKGH